MSHFFKVMSLQEVMGLVETFPRVGVQKVPITNACSRVLAKDIFAKKDMPGFRRSTMDGYAVAASSTYGASESSPAWLDIVGTILMGAVPNFLIEPGQAAKISTGAMLPKGADSVVMVEHTEEIDETSVEIYKSVAPLQYVIDASEDFVQKDKVLSTGTFIRPQEAGLAAGLGFSQLDIYKVPKVGIISTGDEIIPVDQEPKPGQIRDINSYTLAGFVREAGSEPVHYGIVKDDLKELKDVCKKAVKQTDMVLISGGSSVGTRDYTVDVLSSLLDTTILIHGMSISPGKPTILAKSGIKSVWGLPGQVVSAMVVFKIVVVPFLNRIKGLDTINRQIKIPAKLVRNVSSSQGRSDFVRVLLEYSNGEVLARPVLGKSGLIRTMVHADGLLEIGENVEGLEKDTMVNIILL
jgi:molybdopterin molybdotransferase